jgi:hypothetical protein
MVKRISHIIISFLLIVATTGVTLTRHYCGNQLISSSVLGKAHNCCGTHCKSCHDEISSFRVTDNFVASAFKMDQAQQLVLNWLATPGIDLFSITFDHNFTVNKFLFNSSPPIAENSPALLQIFRC